MMRSGRSGDLGGAGRSRPWRAPADARRQNSSAEKGRCVRALKRRERYGDRYEETACVRGYARCNARQGGERPARHASSRCAPCGRAGRAAAAAETRPGGEETAAAVETRPGGGARGQRCVLEKESEQSILWWVCGVQCQKNKGTKNSGKKATWATKSTGEREKRGEKRTEQKRTRSRNAVRPVALLGWPVAPRSKDGRATTRARRSQGTSDGGRTSQRVVLREAGRGGGRRQTLDSASPTWG